VGIIIIIIIIIVSMTDTLVWRRGHQYSMHHHSVIPHSSTCTLYNTYTPLSSIHVPNSTARSLHRSSGYVLHLHPHPLGIQRAQRPGQPPSPCRSFADRSLWCRRLRIPVLFDQLKTRVTVPLNC